LSYSQKKKDLSRLANEYILGSDADIRIVIGIDVKYKGSKKASVSMWRPRIRVNNVGEKELFVGQTVTDQVCSPINP
jgi:deoxyinosine 3'endonuclease (endonuclease V)